MADTKPKLDPYEKPPRALMEIFKSLKSQAQSFSSRQLLTELVGSDPSYRIPADILHEAFQDFQRSPGSHSDTDFISSKIQDIGPGLAYRSSKVPGLVVLPALLPRSTQQKLLSCLFNRDLSNPEHATNLHLHYEVTYPVHQSSFFDDAPDRVAFMPKDSQVHKPLAVKDALKKKLRWMTLGGQYDWTNKVYPDEAPPPFPTDISALIRSLFLDMEPQAAIVNVYSPGDTLSMHRDVSEEVEEGLVSISMGCEALFVIGVEDTHGSEGSTPDVRYEVLRLRSGDAVYMTGESRLAWHGVPIIMPGTCPDYLADWPGDDYPEWKGWMKGKRINLNVRQMFKLERSAS